MKAGKDKSILLKSNYEKEMLDYACKIEILVYACVIERIIYGSRKCLIYFCENEIAEWK